MKFLLTADLHLRADNPERLAALEEVLATCEAESVDYLLIAGDLFDADVDVEKVKPAVRDHFSGNDFETLVIPGNHDRAAYRAEDYFGEDVEVLRRQPFTHRALGDVNLLAVPYFEGDFDDLVEDIAERAEPDMVNVLMLHCTLAGAGGGVFGTESRYLPVTPEELLQTSFEYVVAGHIHSSPTKRQLGDETAFVYPGSPASITERETGRRGVWLLDTEADRLAKRDLDTFHYERADLDLSPGTAGERLEGLRDRLAETDLANATLLVRPEGFVEVDGSEFFADLTSVVEDAGPADYEIDRSGVKSASSIVESDLFRSFREKLEAMDDVDEQAVERVALEALSRQGR